MSEFVHFECVEAYSHVNVCSRACDCNCDFGSNDNNYDADDVKSMCSFYIMRDLILSNTVVNFVHMKF